MRARALMLLLAVLLCWAGPAEGKAAKKTKAPHNREDVPFVRCSVCQEAAKVLARDVKQMKSEKKVKEIDILDKIEKVCDPDTPHGKWIAHIDIVEDGSKLKLEHHEEEGSCGEECRTVARSCEDTIGAPKPSNRAGTCAAPPPASLLLRLRPAPTDDALSHPATVTTAGYHDTDLAETLFSQDLNRIALEKLLCRELTTACTKPTPPLPAGRAPGPAFTPKSEKERYLDELTNKMGDMPGKMSLYSREDMEEEFMSGGPGDDGDDDEEDDEDMFSNAYRGGGQGGGGGAKKAAATKEVGAWEAVSGMVSDAVGGAKKAAAGALEWIGSAVGGGGGAGAKKGTTAGGGGKQKNAAGGGAKKGKKSEF